MEQKKGRKENKMKVILDVPYFSQHSDLVPKNWRNISCGIVAVKMILDFFVKKSPEISFLIDEGIAIDGFVENGWQHESLVRLLRNHGIMSYAQEFRSISIQIDDVHGVTKLSGKKKNNLQNIGIQKIFSKISLGLPVIVSVLPNFNHNKHSHLILITGYDNKNKIIYYHDPDAREGKDIKSAKIKVKEFLKYWRNLAIFLD
jgi:uncharacterized protein YvpB